MENIACLVEFRNLFNPYLTATQKKVSKMVFYRNRLKTFAGWPFTSEGDNCTPENLAKAGFFSTRLSKTRGDTSVKCFCCMKELDGWEAIDNPWDEHKLHQGDCPFIMLNKDEAEWTLEDWMYMHQSSAVKLVELRYKTELEDLQYRLEENETKLEKERRKRRR